MAAQEIVFWSAAETAAAVRSKQVSPVEVVQAYLDRIDRLDSKLNSYITVCGEEALAAARALESSIDRGETSGALLGVPIAVKDQFWTKGHPDHQRLPRVRGFRHRGRTAPLSRGSRARARSSSAS